MEGGRDLVQLLRLCIRGHFLWGVAAHEGLQVPDVRRVLESFRMQRAADHLLCVFQRPHGHGHQSPKCAGRLPLQHGRRTAVAVLPRRLSLMGRVQNRLGVLQGPLVYQRQSSLNSGQGNGTKRPDREPGHTRAETAAGVHHGNGGGNVCPAHRRSLGESGTKAGHERPPAEASSQRAGSQGAVRWLQLLLCELWA